MARPDVRLMTVTRKDRHQLVDGINGVISNAGGWVDDVMFFSNVSVMIACIIPAAAGRSLGQGLRDLGLSLSDAEIEPLLTHTSKPERVVTLNITFVHNDPDLRQTIPAVPG